MDQTFLLFLRRPPSRAPTDEELKQMGLTRLAAEKLVGDLTERQDAALRNTGGGSYLVLLDFALTTHMSFSDLPVLSPAGGEQASRVLQTVRNYTRGFFDRALKRETVPLLDRDNPGDFITEVQRFAPAHRRPTAKAGGDTSWPPYPPLP